MPLRTTLKRGHTLGIHPIQRHPAYVAFVSRPTVEDKISVQGPIDRLLKEMEPVTLPELNPVHVDRAVERLLADEYDVSYVDRMLRNFKTFLTFCYNNRYLDRNLAPSIRRPRLDKMFMPVVVPQDVINTFSGYLTEHGKADDILLWACLRSGCRLGEPLEAQVKHIALNVPTRVPYIWLGTKTTRRRARISNIAFDILVKRIDAAKVNADGGEELIITSIKGTLKDRTWTMRDRFKAFQIKCFGEVKFTPKDMRSTFITNNVNAFPDKLMEIAAQCGTSVATIQKHYFNYKETNTFVGLVDD